MRGSYSGVTDNQSKSSVARSFRLPENWDEMLNEEAQRKGVTVSSLLTQMVRKHLVVDTFYENRIVVLPGELFRQYIDKIDPDDIEKIRDYCKSMISAEVFMRGMSYDIHSILWVLDEVFGNYYGWYKLSNHDLGNERRLYLQHSYGESWSRFLRTFLESFIHELDANATTESDSYHVVARKHGE